MRSSPSSSCRPVPCCGAGWRLLLSGTAQVTGTARELLDALAVAAQPLDEQALLQLCGPTAPEVRAALRGLLSHRLLRTPDAAGRQQLRHALLAEVISGQLLTNAIRDLARRARIELTEPEPPPVERPVHTFGLTDREHAVLRLLGQGKTNARIGATLFISPKTASVHVSNIVRKLDVTTRVQAATLAERAGLLDPTTRSAST
jgi:DNA-binding CsgD family transcriptional regulator